MSEPVIAVVAALPEEVLRFCRRYALERHGVRVWQGAVAGRWVQVHCTGIGMSRARAGLGRILERDPPEALICVGMAGALSATLAVGDLLVADHVVSAGRQGGTVPVPASMWLDRARALEGAGSGILLSTPRIVTTAAEKRVLAGRHAPGRELAAVDMESYAWASLAHEERLPFVVVRAVSDTADEDLPLDLNKALRADGSLSRARVLGAAIRRPAAIPGLLKLRDRVRSCSRVLEHALVSILA